jgi:hypothetical protein
MVRILVVGLAGLTLLAFASAASACPYGETAATTDQSTTTSQVPLPTDGTDTGTKTGG